MKTVRSFLALNLELDTVNKIASEQLALKKDCDEASIKVRWVPPQNMHITIRFLGQVTEPMIYAIKDGVERIASAFIPFSVDAEGFGAFPDTHRANVLWIGIKSRDQSLQRFYGAISGVLEETGFKGDSKPFKSHVTIGRVDDNKGILLADLLRERANTFFGKSIITDLLCYRSDLHPTGADYKLLWRLPLLGSAKIVSTDQGISPPEDNREVSESNDKGETQDDSER